MSQISRAGKSQMASLSGLARHLDGRLSGSECPAPPGLLSEHWFPSGSQVGGPGRSSRRVCYLARLVPNQDRAFFILIQMFRSGSL